MTAEEISAHNAALALWVSKHKKEAKAKKEKAREQADTLTEMAMLECQRRLRRNAKKHGSKVKCR